MRAAPTLPLPQAVRGDGPVVDGLGELLLRARVPEDMARALAADVASVGAVHVLELRRADWCALPSWGTLRPLEQRRLLSLVGS